MSSFAEDLDRGLTLSPKSIPSKYLYDERGAQLFDAICALAAYYPTQTELSILRRNAVEIAAAVGPECDVIELGSGAATKTRALLSALLSRAEAVGSYIPVDIAREQLERTASNLRREYGSLNVQPVCADFTREFPVPERRARRRLVFFPGSTIGNFGPDEAASLLERLRELCRPDGAVLLGVDLKKDPAVLHRAYNDEQGVTAAFNLNLLVRANRELGTDFDVSQFCHYAFYNPAAGRIEMTLVSMRPQIVRRNGVRYELGAGEPVTTEYSYKYEIGELDALAARNGLRVRQAWLDDNRYFAVLLLTPG